MTFQNLSKIVDGVCRNAPAVTAYEKLETKAHLIKRGDLFVGSDPVAISQAIENGAYAILHEGSPIMIDEEVAWIGVTSIEEALVKILRFSLLHTPSLFFHFPPISYDILRQIVKKENVVFLDALPSENFKKILYADANSFFISQDEIFLQNIYPEYLHYHDKKESLLTLTHQSLFLSSFIYEDIHFENVKLPALFLPELNSVLHFLKDASLSFDIDRLSFIEHFKPLFVSNTLTIRPFGCSEHAFIAQPEEKDIQRSLQYIQRHAPWANTLLFVPKFLGNAEFKTSSVYYFDTLEELKDIEVDKFNFILILANYNELSLVLENYKQKRTLSLF